MGSHHIVLNGKNLLKLEKGISLLFFHTFFEYVFIYQSTTPFNVERSTKIAFTEREKFAVPHVDYLPPVWRGVRV
jgi:hypothetical protein